MRIKSLFIYCLIVATSLLSTCKDENETPKQQFVFGEKAISLKGANLYLTDKFTTNDGRDVLKYAISDGTYTNHSGFTGSNFDDYDNETFFILFQLGPLSGEDIAPGKFPIYSDWSALGDIQFDGPEAPPSNSTIGSIFVRSLDNTVDYSFYMAKDDIDGHSPIIITGGLADGQKMTFKYSGKFLYNEYIGSTVNENEGDGKIFYTGTVIDVR